METEVSVETLLSHSSAGGQGTVMVVVEVVHTGVEYCVEITV